MMPRMFCLSCRELKNRQDITMQHFKDNGLDVELWLGTYGPKLGVATTIPNKQSGFIPRRICSLIINYITMWEALKHFPEDEFIIFEDDVVLCDNFKEEFKKSYEALPNDWEMAYLGASGLHTKWSRVINERISEHRWPLGTFAIMYKKSILERLIVENSQLERPIDVMMYFYSLPTIKNYTFIPQLVQVRKEWRSSLWENSNGISEV